MSSGLFEVVNGVDAAILIAAKDGVLLVWVGIPELKRDLYRVTIQVVPEVVLTAKQILL